MVLSPSHIVEAYCLGVLFRKPELLYRLDRQLQGAGLLSLTPDDFDYTDHQLFLKIIRQSLEQVDADHHAYVVNNLPDYISELSRELLAQSEQFKQQDDVLVDDLRRMVKKIRLSKTAEQINQYRFLQEDAQQSGDPRARDYQNETVRLTKLRRLIDNAG